MAIVTTTDLQSLADNIQRWEDWWDPVNATITLSGGEIRTSFQGLIDQWTTVTPQGAWVTSTAYVRKDIVSESGSIYIAVEDHTSGVFATDLAAGKWALYQFDVLSAIEFFDDFTAGNGTFSVDTLNTAVTITSATASAIPLSIDNAVGNHGLSVKSGNNELNDGSEKVFHCLSGTSANDLLTVLSGGNVGIGTSIPDKQFHIENVGASAAIKLDRSDAVTAGYISVESGDTINSIFSTGVKNLVLHVNSIQQMTIDSSGNIGIGDSAPTDKMSLDVGSNTDCLVKLRMGSGNSGNNLSGHTYFNSGDTEIFRSFFENDPGRQSYILQSDSISNILVLDRAGNVGIGEVVPTAALHIDQSSTTAAEPVIKLDQGDISEPFVDFIGTPAADANNSISTLTTSGATTHHIQVDINGVKAWIAVSTTDPS